MDIRQLRYFCTLVEEKSYHRAAAKLYLTQPALSQQILALEKELKTILIKREGKKSVPTEIGLILYRKAKIIIDLSDNTKNEICNFNNNIVGSLRIATSSVSSLLSEKIVEFYKKHPGIFLEIKDGNHDTVMEYLTTGISELAITDYEEYDSKEIKRYVIKEQSFYLCGTSQYIKDGVKEMSIEDLKNVPMIIYPSDFQMLKDAGIKRGIEIKPICYADSTENKVYFAKMGMGICLGSESSARMAKELGMNTAKLKGIDKKIQRCIFWRDNFSLSVAASEFLSTIIDNENYFDIQRSIE